ncbi:acireductone synthase [Leucobacter sp. CSA1]|uniref:Enolase-phosphatase E1 n=1 Tax=Leucobacter chromiisoli TaxID=2796471 RepID=A0A934UVR7_9MICO|nr:acireductone synthase [Leucobacter chromiisoli]MBK0420200.1 acireductone synthase [Leucobacter chromiisoli]
MSDTVSIEKPTAVVLDIEGTTSSTWFVHETLYPYSRSRFAEVLDERADHPDVARARGQIIEQGGLGADATTEQLVATLNGWLDADEKRTPLKTLQGLIWADGFASGDLTSHFFDDAIPAIRRWHDAGIDLYIFSSGSVAAQRSWFGHTPEGDLLPLISAHFDTENAGPKREARSYRAIAEQIGAEPERIVFLSDLAAELDAAQEAGWRTVGVRRKGDQHYDAGVAGHPEIASFAQVAFQ